MKKVFLLPSGLIVVVTYFFGHNVPKVVEEGYLKLKFRYNYNSDDDDRLNAEEEAQLQELDNKSYSRVFKEYSIEITRPGPCDVLKPNVTLTLGPPDLTEFFKQYEALADEVNSMKVLLSEIDFD